jgi:hypothetical protein
MFFSLWIVIPVAVLLVLVVVYLATFAYLMIFAEYFARGPADGADFIYEPIPGEQLNFAPVLRRSRLTRRHSHAARP